MNVYMYGAALYSGAGLIEVLIREGRAAPFARTGGVEALLDEMATGEGIDRADESSFDSCTPMGDQPPFPKGPFADGGGEADCPQHCDATGEFLDNPLTEDGSAYVKQAFKAYATDARGNLDVLRVWAGAYVNEYTEACEEAASEGLIAEDAELIPEAEEAA